MPRACVIVLDAVGAGELPDAADWGDEGSDTLGNVSRAVGGLDLPNLQALGLANVPPLEGCPPQPYAPAVAGSATARSTSRQTTALVRSAEFKVGGGSWSGTRCSLTGHHAFHSRQGTVMESASMV